MEWVSKPEFKRLHPDLSKQELGKQWKTFEKNQQRYLYNQYHGLKDDQDLSSVTGFRMESKNKYLKIKPKHRKIVPDGFDLQESKKNYLCHLFYPNGTYFTDIFFTGSQNKMYLMLLDFHTRKLYARPLQIKKSYQLYEALYEIMTQNDLVGKIKFLIADGEKGFQGPQFETLFLIPYKIKFIPVKKDEIYPHYRIPNHDKLGVINRVMRTIRDMAYVAGIPDPIPEKAMQHLVNTYNRAPHTFLSKYYGHPISPNEVDEEKKLKIWRRVQQHNYNVSKRRGFYIKPGSRVAVYNDDDPLRHKRRMQVRPVSYTVKGYRNGGYDVIDDFGRELNVSRYKMKLIPKD